MTRKPAKIQTALSEFTTAVLNAVRQVSIEVPAEQRASSLIHEHAQAEVLKTALALSPRDPPGKGM